MSTSSGGTPRPDAGGTQGARAGPVGRAWYDLSVSESTPERADYINWSTADFQWTPDGYELVLQLSEPLVDRQVRLAEALLKQELHWFAGARIVLTPNLLSIEAPESRLFSVDPVGLRTNIEDAIYAALRRVDAEVRTVDEAQGEPWLTKLKEAPARRDA
jgi:hypothetical protein